MKEEVWLDGLPAHQRDSNPPAKKLSDSDQILYDTGYACALKDVGDSLELLIRENKFGFGRGEMAKAYDNAFERVKALLSFRGAEVHMRSVERRRRKIVNDR